MGRRRWLLALALLASACGSDEELGSSPDASAPDAGGADADAGSGGGSGTDASDGAAGSAGFDSGLLPSISNSSSSLVETETNVVAAPDGRVAATWIGISGGSKTHIGYALSADDGQTWQPPAVLESPDGRVSSDPVVAVGEDSSFYLSWIGFERDASGNPLNMRVYVAKAGPGELAFDGPKDVTGPVASDSVDKPWSTVDNDGTLYVTWLDTGEPRMRIAVSKDGADTFQIHDIDDGQGFRNLIFPCLDEVTGRLYVVYHPGGGIGLRYSDDQGSTWPGVTAVADPADPDAMFDDPTCVAHGGQVWVAYGIGTDTFDKTTSPRSDRLRIAHSTDGGDTIAARYFAEDPAAGTKFMHAQLARDAAGALHIVYYAGGDADPDPNGSVRLSRSTDGGKTWEPSSVVQQPNTFLRARNSVQWLGDYIGLHTRGARVYVTYADNTSGFSHVRFFAD